MTSLIDRFIPEAREYLESAASGLLRLERSPDNDAIVNEVFRALHTLKGSSGLFDVPGLTRLVHAGEDVLVAVRENALTVNSELVDLLLDSLDWVAKWIDALEAEHRLPDNADGISASLSLRLRALLPAAAENPAATVAGFSDQPPAWLETLPERIMAEATSLAAAQAVPVFALTYRPDDACFFRGEDPLNLMLQLDGLVALNIEGGAFEAIADTDPFRCNLVFQAIVQLSRTEIEYFFRYVLENVVIYPLSIPAREPPIEAAPARSGSTLSAANGNGHAQRILAEQIRILGLCSKNGDLRRRIAGIEVTAAAVLAGTGAQHRLEALTEAARAAEQGEFSELAELLSELATSFAETTPTPQQPVAATIILERPQSVAVPAQSGFGDGPGPSVEARPGQGKVLKVDQSKIDALMNLIGELVVSKNSLPFLAKRAETDYGSREMAREIKDQYAIIDRLATEMQRAVMNVRLLPVSEVFNRFPRLVRDLSRKLDKQINLAVEGEETAVDKNIIEALADPLIHIIRNSIDHGIETTARRIELGKSETAEIHLRAYQDGDLVMIEIADDGKGINPQTIRAKAIEKRLITQDQASALTDAEAINLVFLPGFSTAAEISDLSGRGVGMDVVRTAIEKVNGTVTLSSQTGRGTMVRLALPLSMVVTRVMMVDVAGVLYGIPMDNVIETVRIPSSDIKTIKNAEAFVHRGELVPVMRMRKLLKVDGNLAAVNEEAIVIAKIGGSSAGLIIDKFRGNIDLIVKPLDGILSQVKVFTGSSLLGDGRVLLVVNLKELLK